MQITSPLPASSTATIPAWGLFSKLFFRFWFSFFAAYFLIYYDSFWVFSELPNWLRDKALYNFVPWFGKQVLQIPYEISAEPSGSGDTTYECLLTLILLVVAAISCLVWSSFDRRRSNYEKLYHWLAVAMRYYLAFILLSYGFEKVYKLQFPFPNLERLVQPYGESSPMGLAWTFMGYSKLYNYFTGFAEILGGVLLLFRRTTTLGALVSLMVMINVAMMNYSFDIPVKLFSTTLVAMCLFLLACDARKLYGFFVLHQSTALHSLPELFPTNTRLRWMGISFKYASIGFALFSNIQENREFMAKRSDESPRQPLYGIYNVETFVSGHDTLPPLATDSIRWKQLIVHEEAYASIRLTNDVLAYYEFKPDTLKHRIKLISYDDSTRNYSFAYSMPDDNHLILTGNWTSDTIRVHFKKYDVNRFPLVSTGFHWISEYPNNQ